MTNALFVSSARRRTPSLPVFGGIANLYADHQKGAYFDFTNVANLAVNADGSGGSPLVGGSARWCRDLGPNANHLRNTVSAVSVQSGGIATSGTSYGLFNMQGFGDWPVVAEPLTMIACLEILSFRSADDRILGSNGTGQVLQGTSAGAIRLFSNYSPEMQPGLNREFVLTGVYNGPRSSVALDHDLPVSWISANGAMDALCLGSGTGGGSGAAVRFKRLFVREGLLSDADRAGVLNWAMA